MVAKKKAPEYEPIGDTISMGSAFVQATAALDAAAHFAIEGRDATTLLQVAALWIEMGTHLTGPAPDDDEEIEEAELEADLTPTVGFGPATPKEIGANKNGKS